MKLSVCTLVAAIALGVAASAHAGPTKAKEIKLNVLVICGDDHAAHALGCYGNKLVRTPNLDRLAAQGILFDRAYCNAPVCTPSRQAILTGRYPRSLGVTQLRTALPETENTLARMLARAGYVTGAIGKMHFNSNLSHGFEVRYDLPEYRKDLAKREAKPVDKDIETQPPWKPFKDYARTWLNSKALPMGLHQSEMSAAFYLKEAEKFLKGEASAKPFFLMVSFHEPHSPFHFPVEYRGKYDPSKFPVPKVGPGDDFQVPAIFRDLSDKEKQGIAAAYHTSVEYLDHNIGALLDLLDKLGLAETTLVVYLGDHGYCLGHHGRFEKHSMWEEAVRAPLLVRLPGKLPAAPEKKGGRRSRALVSLFDVVPTVLDLCEQPIPPTVQAQSFKAALLGKAEKHRDLVFVEYSENEEALVRTERWAFMYGTGKRKRNDGYHTGKPEPGRTLRLYDMKDDPEQTTNVAEKPDNAKVVEELTQALVDHLRRTARQPELIPRTGDVHELLEHLLQPRDLETGKKKEK